MEIGATFSVSQNAMVQDTVRMNEIAHRIASNTGGDIDNLIEDMTEMGVIKGDYQANAKVISTMNDVLENLLGMV